MTTKQELIQTINTLTEECNELTDSIFQLNREVNAFDDIIADLKVKATEKVLELANDEVFKKELSNETKRQIKIKSLLAEHKETFDNAEKKRKDLELEQHKFSKKHRRLQSAYAISKLIGE